ncbi:hypothetical protein ACWEF9_21630 [Streptomyces sp. NPDC004980]
MAPPPPVGGFAPLRPACDPLRADSVAAVPLPAGAVNRVIRWIEEGRTASADDRTWRNPAEAARPRDESPGA